MSKEKADAVLARPSYNGWAPGDTLNKCDTCTNTFIGSSRARKCSPCAYKVHDILDKITKGKEELVINMPPEMEELAEVPVRELGLELALYRKTRPGSLLRTQAKGYVFHSPPTEKKPLVVSTTEETKVLGNFRKGQFYPSGKRTPIPGKMTNWWYASKTEMESDGSVSGAGPVED